MKPFYVITICLANFLCFFLIFKPSNNFYNSANILPGENIILVEEYIRGPLPQNDSRIIEYVKSQGFIQPPPTKNKPYMLEKPNIDPSMGQSQIVKEIFKGKKNGFFVECGALDGETRSNTLSLEKDFGWKGLLVEADPMNFELLLKKNRKAWSANCCLAVHPYPHEVIFEQNFNMGKIKSELGRENQQAQNDSGVRVQCLPLFSLLIAIGVKTVDYFSLDVEGFELAVLETIPFELLTIKVLTVEFTHGKGGSGALIEFMEDKDYRMVTKLTHRKNLANDVIFAHNSFPIEAEFPLVIESEKMDLNPDPGV